MKLNDAILLRKVIDGVECSSMREFVSKLVKAKDLSMKVYVNTKLVCSGPATLSIDNHWVIASTNAQMAYTDSVPVESIVARVMQNDVVLFESITPCGTIIPMNDTAAMFHVCLVNDSPYNELSKRVPDSSFRSKLTAKLPPVDFNEIDVTINDNAEVEPLPATPVEPDPSVTNNDPIPVDPIDGGDEPQPDVLATSGTISVTCTGSTDLVASPLWVDDETFSPGFELQVTQNVSHTLMIPLTNVSAEISISDVDGLGLDSDIQYVDPLPDNQQRPDVVKNARVQFTIGVDYVLLSVNVWIAEAP